MTMIHLTKLRSFARLGLFTSRCFAFGALLVGLSLLSFSAFAQDVETLSGEEVADEQVTEELIDPPTDEAAEPEDQQPEELAAEEQPADEPTDEAVEIDLADGNLSEENQAEESLPEEEPVDADNPGQSFLDQALEAKISAQSLKDLAEVIDLLDTAIEEGLDVDNTEFAEQMLVASLMHRGGSISGAVLKNPMPNPAQATKFLELRMFALTDLQRATSLDENQFQAWMLIGRLQSLKGGNKGEARRAMTKVIQYAAKAVDDPNAESLPTSDLAQAFALRGAAQHNASRRLRDLSKAVELAPEKAEYLILRSQSHLADSHPEKCIEDLDHAIELAPENPKAHELKALALLMSNKPEEAIKSFNRTSEIVPNSLTPYQYRGEIYRKKGQLNEAVQQLNKAIEISPRNIASLLIRSELLLGLAHSIENPAAEEIVAEELDEKVEGNELLLEEEGAADRVEAAKKYREQALKDVMGALKINPKIGRAHMLRGRVLASLGRNEEALDLFKQLLKVAPDNLQLQFQVAALNIDLGRAVDAADALTKILDVDPENILAIRLRGDMRLMTGDHAGAIEDFATSVEKDPLDSSILNNYAWTLSTSPYEEVRDGKLAVELANKAAEATSFKQPHILSTLAASYAEAGEFEQAIKWAEKAVALMREAGDDLYDGQLEAELESYRNDKPWREVQREEGTIAGPEGDELSQGHAGGKTLEVPEADSKEAASDAETDIEAEEPARSSDF